VFAFNQELTKNNENCVPLEKCSSCSPVQERSHSLCISDILWWFHKNLLWCSLLSQTKPGHSTV